MKMCMKKSVMALCLVFFACLCMNVYGVNADEVEEPVVIEIDSPYEFVWSASCNLSISSGSASVVSIVDGAYGTSVSVNVYLEKFVNGSWQPYYSWSHSGGRYLNNTDSTSVSPGLYRVWMSVTAYGAGGGVESFNVDGNMSGY